MLKILSTFRKKKTGEPVSNGSLASGGGTNGTAPNGTVAANGTATSNGYTHSNGVNAAANGTATKGQSSKQHSSSAFGSSAKEWSEPDHSVTRGDVDSSFEQFAQLIQASSRPLPTQTGDGSYIEHEAHSSLFQDIRHLGIKDMKTLQETLVNKATGALADDKTMLMERIIQVCLRGRRPSDI